ncbi:MAG: hypothetical protein KKE20_07530, partial [Nanoarchaeota archaeon]|nr:hypothetical protein [Nanoarchaeota archaeon]
MKFAKIFFMMMLCLVILLKVSSAQVERSSEMTGDYFSGDSFEFRDDMYIVKVNSYDQVILEYSGKYLVIKNNSCSRKDIYFDFCVESIEYDYDEKDKKASIEIFSSLPEIEVERDISDPEVMVGETTRITDTITNTGQRKAYNVTFLDTYPLSINISIPIKYRNTVEIRRDQKIKLANGSTVKAYTVFWQDNLDIVESMTFAYDLTALQPLDEDFYSKIIYFN